MVRLPYQDIHFQLIDLPPVSPEHPIAWLANALQPADACLLIVDLGQPDCVDQVTAVLQLLAEKRVTLTDRWKPEPAAVTAEELEDPFAIRLPTLLLAGKTDQIPHLDEELQIFRELTELTYPAITVSTVTGEGLDRLGPWLFRQLGIARVYTKIPGRPPDRDRPFTVRHGQTVYDVALLVHRDIAQALKYARLWNAQFNGQQVGRDYAVADGDIIELHT